MIQSIPMQIQMEKIPTEVTDTAMPHSNESKFGSVLAMMTARNEMPVLENENLLFESIDEVISQLLTMTTTEELKQFLQNNHFHTLQEVNVIDGQLFIPQETMDLLQTIVPTVDNIIQFFVEEEESFVLDIRELLNEVEQFLQNNEIEKMFEGFTDEQIIAFVSFTQLLSIEVPKVDLTLSQEHRLFSLQQMTKQMGEDFNTNKESDGQARSFIIPESKSTSAKPNPFLVQGGHSFVMNSSIDIQRIVGEVEGSHRAEQLIKQLENIFKRANFGQTGGTNRISIRLYPEHLGHLRIELLQTNGLLTARILASSALGKEMLESQLHQLRQAFLHQNIQVERIDISQMLTETPQDERDRTFDQHFKQQHEPNPQEEEQGHDEEEQMSFEEYMIELEG